MSAVFLALLLLLSVHLPAQRYLGGIQGEVSDGSGARVADAEVTVEEGTTHFRMTAQSNVTGVYNFPALQPGTYTVQVNAKGFKPAKRTNVTLTAGLVQKVDFTISVDVAVESVTVSGAGETALIDTSSANIATTIDMQEVRDLPNNGRNPYIMTTFAAGVTYNGYFTSKASGGTNPFSGAAVQITSNGTTGHNRLTLNGIPNDTPERFSGASYAGFTPSPEAVQEVKVGVSIFDAQVGHGNGTVSNTVVRGGGNDLHGAAYLAFQNTYLNANTYERVPNQNLCWPGSAGCTNTVTPTRRSNQQLTQTGFVVTGPVVLPKVYNGRNKTYFMLSYEHYRSHSANQYSALMPNARLRAGDFGELCSTWDGSGRCTAGRQIYDPLSPIVNGQRTTYFPYNNLAGPNSDGVTRGLNNTGVALMSYLPCPSGGCNTAYNPSATYNFIATDTTGHNSYPSVIGRLDQTLGPKNQFSVILFRAALAQTTPLANFPKGIGPAGSGLGGYTASRRTMGGSIDDVHQFNSTTVLDSRFGITWHPFSLQNPFDQNFDLSSIGMSSAGLPYTSFPGITNNSDGPTVSSGTAGGATNTSQVSTAMNGSIEEVLSKTLNRHSLRFGLEANLLNYNVQQQESGFSGLVIDRTLTQLRPATGDAVSGSGFASLLLGYHNSMQYTIAPSYALQQRYLAPFVQDDWRVNQRLSVNLGLRWDYESPFTERYNKFVAGFCTTCVNPYQTAVATMPLYGGLQYASATNRHAYKSDFTAFQPRLGVAYNLRPGTVLRAGFGKVYLNTLETPIGTGFSQNTGTATTGTSGSNVSPTFQPITTLSNPFPNGVTAPTGSTMGMATGVGANVSFYDPNHEQPLQYQFTVNVQQELPWGIQLQVGWLENRVRKIEVSQDINALPEKYYSHSTDPAANLANQTYLTTAVANPMAGLLPATALASLNSATIQRYLLLKPFPEFGAVTEVRSIGSQQYDALQIQASHPMRHHLSLQGNFTWNKLMRRDTLLNNFGPDSGPASFADPASTIIWKIFGTVELPSFASRPYYQRTALGGWKLNGVLMGQNGIQVPAPSNVDIIGDPLAGAPHTFARMFNTCYQDATGAPVNSKTGIIACDATSTVPAFRQRYSYTVQRNTPYINTRQIIYPLLNASLFKQFPMTHHTSLEIRGEFFNILNHPLFGMPGTGLNSSTYGKVTMTQVNDPRLGQLTARINF